MKTSSPSIEISSFERSRYRKSCVPTDTYQEVKASWSAVVSRGSPSLGVDFPYFGDIFPNVKAARPDMHTNQLPVGIGAISMVIGSQDTTLSALRLIRILADE